MPGGKLLELAAHTAAWTELTFAPDYFMVEVRIAVLMQAERPFVFSAPRQQRVRKSRCERERDHGEIDGHGVTAEQI
jgi:hypothetical protein